MQKPPRQGEDNGFNPADMNSNYWKMQKFIEEFKVDPRKAYGGYSPQDINKYFAITEQRGYFTPEERAAVWKKFNAEQGGTMEYPPQNKGRTQ